MNLQNFERENQCSSSRIMSFGEGRGGESGIRGRDEALPRNLRHVPQNNLKLKVNYSYNY